MQTIRGTKAVSTLIPILLILVSFIFGALASYIWVMASFYNMPESQNMLVMEDAAFTPANFTYFNVTVLNPSNSVSDVNITAFRLTVEGTNQTYTITSTEHPGPLPYLLKKGTRQSFKCIRNWSNFTNQNVKIEPVAEGALFLGKTYTTPNVKLNITPLFNSTESIEYFKVIVNHGVSVANLTLREMLLFGQTLSVEPSWEDGYVMPPNTTEMFRVNYNWESQRGIPVLITVKTMEGYEAQATTESLLGAVLTIDKVEFDYTDTTHFNATVTNAEDSTALATLDSINITLPDNSTISLDTIPALNITLPMSPNTTRTMKCLWDWSSLPLRNQTITVRVFTKQGFTLISKTVRTPAEVVLNTSDVGFDLEDLNHFSVNIRSFPCSLRDVNITTIKLNNDSVTFDPPFAVLSAGAEAAFNCTYNWTSLRGENVTITAMTEDGLSVSRNTTISSLGLKFIGEPVLSELLGPYVNITIANSMNSLTNATITRIMFSVWTEDFEVDGNLTAPRLGENCIVQTGGNLTITCRWDWTVHQGVIAVTVYTSEGVTLSQTFYPPTSP